MAAKTAGAPVEAPTQTVRVIAWTWRDGSVHLEVPMTTFHNEDGTMFTHLDSHANSRFVTACGVPWWGIGSSSGYGDSARITCEPCRQALRDAVLQGTPLEQKLDDGYLA